MTRPLKVAVLLKGSAAGVYKHWQYGDFVGTDISIGFENMRHAVLDKYECDIFMHTWRHPEQPAAKYEDILEFTSPVSYLIEDDISGAPGKDLGEKTLRTTQQVIDLYTRYVEENAVSYDLIILTRCDWWPFHELKLEKILEDATTVRPWSDDEDAATESLKNKIFVYSRYLNLPLTEIDKETTKEQGIDDTMVIFSPTSLQAYARALEEKKNSPKPILLCASVDESPFFPLQHPSLHHIYYLLDDEIVIKNLVHIFTYTNQEDLHGVVKILQPGSDLLRACTASVTQLTGVIASEKVDNIFVFPYNSS